MPQPALTTPVPHSVGLNRPRRPLPPGACDSHMHIFDPRFAPSSHWPRTPPVAPVAAYRRAAVAPGAPPARWWSRHPLTAPTTPARWMRWTGTGRRCARCRRGGRRGQLGSNSAHLAARRVRGLRVNFVLAPIVGAPPHPTCRATLARKVADHPDCAGWRIIQIFVHPEQLIELAPQLHTLPVPLVIDHLGLRRPGPRPCCSRPMAWCAGLLDGGNTWVNSRVPICDRPCMAPATLTRCRWAGRWCRLRQSADVGQRLAAAPPRRPAP